MKRLIAPLAVLVCLLAFSLPAQAHHDNLPLSGFGTPSIDGEGSFSNDSGITVYEFSHPFDSTDNEHDMSSRFGDTSYPAAATGGCSLMGESQRFSYLIAGCGLLIMVLAWLFIRKNGGGRNKSWK